MNQTSDIPAQTGQISHIRKPVLSFRDFTPAPPDNDVATPYVGVGTNRTIDADNAEVVAQVQTGSNQMQNETAVEKDEANKVLAEPDQDRNEHYQTGFSKTTVP